MQDNMKCNNIHIIGIPEGEEEEQGIENLFEKVMMENFPNLMREKVTKIQETQRVPSKRNPKRPTARHIIIKMAKFQDKERIYFNFNFLLLFNYGCVPFPPIPPPHPS